MDWLITHLILIPALILVSSPVIVWKGFVFMKLWLWFITPRFGLPVLSLAQSMGVILAVMLLTTIYQKTKEGEEQAWTNYFISGYILPASTLGLGYLITLFM